MIAILLVPNGLFVIYNDNTSFVAQAVVQAGDTYMIRPFLKNHSGVDQDMMLLAETSPGFRVNVVEVSDRADVTAVSGRGTEKVWAITVDDAAAGENFDLEITIEVLPQVVPGWYELRFTTEAFATTTTFD